MACLCNLIWWLKARNICSSARLDFILRDSWPLGVIESADKVFGFVFNALEVYLTLIYGHWY